jgi:hypothetical protein
MPCCGAWDLFNMKELAYQIDDDDDEIRKDKMGKACSIQEG